MSSTYNGWTNRATWLVHLHLTNDYELYLASLDVVRHAYLTTADHEVSVDDTETARLIGDAINEAGQGDTFQQVYDVLSSSDALCENEIITIHRNSGLAAEVAIREYVEGLTYVEGRTPDALLSNDLVGQALADVDWREVAGALLDAS